MRHPLVESEGGAVRSTLAETCFSMPVERDCVQLALRGRAAVFPQEVLCTAEAEDGTTNEQHGREGLVFGSSGGRGSYT